MKWTSRRSGRSWDKILSSAKRFTSRLWQHTEKNTKWKAERLQKFVGSKGFEFLPTDFMFVAREKIENEDDNFLYSKRNDEKAAVTGGTEKEKLHTVAENSNGICYFFKKKLITFCCCNKFSINENNRSDAASVWFCISLWKRWSKDIFLGISSLNNSAFYRSQKKVSVTGPNG